MGKLTIEDVETGKVSDGYHTFDELYEHRVLLWINLCLTHPLSCYVVEEHYPGWFLLGMQTEHGQISYHCSNKYLSMVPKILFTREAPLFDHHNSQDVLERLVKLANVTPPS